jgi:hypothetical protein
VFGGRGRSGGGASGGRGGVVFMGASRNEQKNAKACYKRGGALHLWSLISGIIGSR